MTKEEKLEYDAYGEGELFNKAYTTTRIFVEENGRKSLLFDIDFKKAFRHNQVKSQEE